MEKFPNQIKLPAVSLDRDQVDTDQIIPANFLKGIDRILGGHLFDALRFKIQARLGTSPDERERNPDFVFNKFEVKFPGKKPGILIGGVNFGCGSSREHAPYALKDYGFQVVIAPSFADIFYKNCAENGILLITLPKEWVDILHERAEASLNGETPFEIIVDLENRQIIYVSKESGQATPLPFEISDDLRHKLLNGLDSITETKQQFGEEIPKFVASAREKFPWMFHHTNLAK